MWFKEVSVKPLDRAGAAASLPQSAKFVKMWGKEGQAPGEFHIPIGIAINAADEVFVPDHYSSRDEPFVVDSYNHRVQKFTVTLE